MKIDLKTMLLTFGICILFAFTTNEIIRIAPATPKNVVAITANYSSVGRTIDTYARLGYIYKSHIIEKSGLEEVILIFEKYD